jgi:surfactin synthase thioesterase subunit
LRSPARVVFLVRTTLAVPFGPDCAFPSESKAAILRQVDAVAAVSQYVADYVRRWSGIPAVHVPISLPDPGPYPALGRFKNEYVTMVNPCAVKGISILLGLADALPEVRFAAVPTWGTNAADRAALTARANITLLPPADHIDRLLEMTRVLLVPSLWAEARSRIVVEAMLRGVPVLAANVGGIPEAMMGMDYLLPVRPIPRYDTRLDERMVPLAEVPAQDIGPWREALSRLVTDRAAYDRLSRTSRAAALDYAASVSVAPFEKLLEETLARPRGKRQEAGAGLSPDRQKLLALRMRKRAAAEAWFPSLDAGPGVRLRLFAFPHAGGGAMVFHRWAALLRPEIALSPVRLPGRESRTAEPPYTRMEALVEALAEAIRPHLSAPFAFFGHSMGAAVAFELARALRRRGEPLPRALLVSGARAPQFRRGHVPPPEPSEAELLAEVRNLEGLPDTGDQDALRQLIPILRADTALYRGYVYREEAPLDCPIFAYGGDSDPNVTGAHLEAWGAQTAAAFACLLFPGGHFYLRTAEAALVRQLRADLAAGLE